MESSIEEDYWQVPVVSTPVERKGNKQDLEGKMMGCGALQMEVLISHMGC
jgi:hypothetical protein